MGRPHFPGYHRQVVVLNAFEGLQMPCGDHLNGEIRDPIPLFSKKTGIYGVREKYYLDFYTLYLVKFFGSI